MGSLASPLAVAAIGGAVLWPLATGVVIVACSKARWAARARRAAALERQLQGLYRTVSARPVPSQLAMVLDALAEGEELASGGPIAPDAPEKAPPAARSASKAATKD